MQVSAKHVRTWKLASISAGAEPEEFQEPRQKKRCSRFSWDGRRGYCAARGRPFHSPALGTPNAGQFLELILVAGTKLCAMSGLHLGCAANRQAFLETRSHPDDWPILADDVGQSAADLETAFTCLSAPDPPAMVFGSRKSRSDTRTNVGVSLYGAGELTPFEATF